MGRRLRRHPPSGIHQGGRPRSSRARLRPARLSHLRRRPRIAQRRCHCFDHLYDLLRILVRPLMVAARNPRTDIITIYQLVSVFGLVVTPVGRSVVLPFSSPSLSCTYILWGRGGVSVYDSAIYELYDAATLLNTYAQGRNEREPRSPSTRPCMISFSFFPW